MSHSKYRRAAEIQNAIREILLRERDPLGVGENPNLADEYDSFIPPIYRILAGARSQEQLVEFLVTAARELAAQQDGQNTNLSKLAQQLLALNVCP